MGTFGETYRTLALLLLVLATSYTDLKVQRIRNIHTFPAMMVGLLLGAVRAGTSGVIDSVLGMLVALGVLGLLFAMNVLCAGDVKLAMAVGALLGPASLGRSFILACALYLPVGLIVLLVKGKVGGLGQAFKRMGRFFYTAFHPLLDTEPLGLEGVTMAPFGMVLGVAALIAHFVRWDGIQPIGFRLQWLS